MYFISAQQNQPSDDTFPTFPSFYDQQYTTSSSSFHIPYDDGTGQSDTYYQQSQPSSNYQNPPQESSSGSGFGIPGAAIGGLLGRGFSHFLHPSVSDDAFINSAQSWIENSGEQVSYLHP